MNIGIPISFNKAQYNINKAYIEYIKESGYNPVVIFPESDLDFIVNICQGLLLPGGIDLDPIFYRENNLASDGSDPGKDDFERRVLWAFTDANKPVFGICRGFQLIVREFIREQPKFEELLQYWQHINSHSLVVERKVNRSQPTHSVRCRLEDLYGQDTGNNITDHFVNSMHHQAVIAFPPPKVGNKPSKISMIYGDLKIIAYTNRGTDNKVHSILIEGVKIFGNKNWMGVQWHPEELKDYNLLHNFFGVETVQEQTT